MVDKIAGGNGKPLATLPKPAGPRSRFAPRSLRPGSGALLRPAAASYP